MHEFRIAGISLLVLIPVCACSTDRAADITSMPWASSNDGQLALRISVDASVVDRHAPIVLIAQLANHGNKDVWVKGPFADSYRATSVGVDLQGPNGPLKYTGPSLEYTLVASSFDQCKPGESLTERLEFSTDHIAGADAPGKYSLTFTYKYSGEWDHVEDGKSAWQGEIVSNTVTFRRQ